MRAFYLSLRSPMAILFSWGLMVSLLGLAPAVRAEIYHAQGEMAGEVTASGVLLQSRLTAIPGPELDAAGDIPGAAGVACFEYGLREDLADARRTDWLEAVADRDFVVRAVVDGLQAGTVYFYRLIYGANAQETTVGPLRRFKTLPLPESLSNVRFAMGSCQNYAFFMNGKKGEGNPIPEHERQLGYPVYEVLKKLEPDFFIGTGDIVYYDHPVKTAARTLPELRRKWHEQARLPRLVAFYGQTAAFWSKDDHDFRFDDADRAAEERLPDTATGIEVFREQMPMLPMDDSDSPSYRTHRINRHLQLWFVEGRDYRSPNRMPDGPDKTIWGREQRQWLQETLKASDATFKLIISPTPIVGPDRNSKKDNHTNLQGFRYEGESFLRWLKEEGIQRVSVLCGDRHWQYHSIHPDGVHEFGCGALNDENAIPGERPGGPKTTDPEGLIEQVYLYPEPTGGFLQVALRGEAERQAELTMTFFDDEGAQLYEFRFSHEDE
jgi:alkaline phosphatase D